MKNRKPRARPRNFRKKKRKSSRSCWNCYYAIKGGDLGAWCMRPQGISFNIEEQGYVCDGWKQDILKSAPHEICAQVEGAEDHRNNEAEQE